MGVAEATFPPIHATMEEMNQTPSAADACEGYARALSAAAEAGLTAAELEELLDLRVGPEPKRRLRDLLEDRVDIVLAQIRLRGRLQPCNTSRKIPLAPHPFVT